MKQILFLLSLWLLCSPAAFAEVPQKYQRLARVIERCAPFFPTFVNAGYREDVSPYLLVGIAVVESACNPKARSPIQANNGEHAEGLMQILPSTYKYIGLGGDPYNAHHSIFSAARYINRHLREFVPKGSTTKPHKYAHELMTAYHRGPAGALVPREIELSKKYVKDANNAWQIAPCVLSRVTPGLSLMPDWQNHCHRLGFR